MSKFCHNCGSELADDEVFCANCGTKVEVEKAVPNVAPQPIQPKSKSPIEQFVNGVKKFRRIMFAVSLAFVLLVGLVSCFGGGSTIEVKSGDLLQAYVQDQKAAEKKYKDKNVKITGMIKHKSQFSNTNNFSLYLEGEEIGGKRYTVIIDVPADKVDVINKSVEGKYISVEGKCIGIVPQDNPKHISIQVQADKVSQ